MNATRAYLYRVLVSFDMFCNVLLFEGLPDETISAHAGRMCKRHAWWAVHLNSFLNWLQPTHCILAQHGDEQRAEAVEDMEEEDLK